GRARSPRRGRARRGRGSPLEDPEALRLRELVRPLQLPPELPLSMAHFDDQPLRPQLVGDRKEPLQRLLTERDQEDSDAAALPCLRTFVGQELNDTLDSDREPDARIGRTVERVEQPVLPPATGDGVTDAAVR